MLFQDLMTRKVFTLQRGKKLFIAQQIMEWAHVRHVPVVDAGQRLVGMLSHRDLLRAAISSETSSIATMERRQHLAQIAVGDVMRERVISIGPQATCREAAKLMLDNKIGALPVVDEDSHLLGILTTQDLLQLVP